MYKAIYFLDMKQQNQNQQVHNIVYNIEVWVFID